MRRFWSDMFLFCTLPVGCLGMSRWWLEKYNWNWYQSSQPCLIGWASFLFLCSSIWSSWWKKEENFFFLSKKKKKISCSSLLSALDGFEQKLKSMSWHDPFLMCVRSSARGVVCLASGQRNWCPKSLFNNIRLSMLYGLVFTLLIYICAHIFTMNLAWGSSCRGCKTRYSLNGNLPEDLPANMAYGLKQIIRPLNIFVII